MKIFYFFPIVFLSIVFYGCTPDSNETLTGKWESQTCASHSISISPFEIWVKGLFEFTNTGLLIYSVKLYSDSNCIEIIPAPVPTSSFPVILDPLVTINVFGVVSYIDQGPVILQEGIDGHYVTFHIDFPPEFVDVDAAFTRVGNNICFSDGIVVNTSTILFSKTADESINFSNCVTLEKL